MTKYSRAIYERAPAVLQNVAVSAVGFRNRRSRYGGHFDEYLREYESQDRWPLERIRTLQWARVREQIGRAARTELYPQLWAETGVDMRAIKSLEDLARLPVLEKKHLAGQATRILSRTIQRSDVTVQTSGTTGTSLRFWQSRTAEQRQWAVWWRYRRWHGIPRNARLGLFASAPVVPRNAKRNFWRVNAPENEVRFSVYHISHETVEDYIHGLNHHKPTWIHGNPSALNLLARLALERGTQLSYSPRWLTTGSENLLPPWRDSLQEFFGIAPRQHYGLAEPVANISECPAGSLHVDEDFSYVEFVPVAGTEYSRIIGTAFVDDLSVWLRYDTGDLARVLKGTCACGRYSRRIETLDGRQGDYIVLPSGARVASLASPIHATPDLLLAQIVQESPSEIRVLLVPRDGATLDLVSLERQMRERIGSEIGIKFELVDDIPRTPGGKHRLVVSSL